MEISSGLFFCGNLWTFEINLPLCNLQSLYVYVFNEFLYICITELLFFDWSIIWKMFIALHVIKLWIYSVSA